MHKPVIIAICGKSASGKDTLARALARLIGYRSHLIVSSTSRPPRRSEVNGVDYHFVKKDSEPISNYLEWCYFRGWFYGTRKAEVMYDKINIGVFNPAGIRSLLEHQDTYDIYVILCQEYIFTRLKRSIRRDGLHLEMFRRLFTDWRDFQGILDLLDKCNHLFIPFGSICGYKNAVDVVEHLERRGVC